MRKRDYVKWVILCVCLLSVIGLSGLVKFRSRAKRLESTNIEKLVNVQEGDNISATAQNEKLRQYNKYAADIEMMKNGYFKGIQTISYMHEFGQSTNRLLVKLNLNSQLGTQQNNQESHIDITDVLVNGEKATFEQEHTDLWIELDKVVEQGQEVNISLAFNGRLIKDNSQDSIRKGKMSWQGSFLPKMGVFEEYKGWNNIYDYDTYPCDYSEIADYRVSLLTEEKKVPIVTGTLIEERKLEDQSYKYVYEAKKARDIGVYYGDEMDEYVVQTTSGNTLLIYTDRSVDIGIIGARVNEIFNYYTGILGRYPYDVFKIIDVEGMKDTITYSGMLMTDLEESNIYYERMYEGIGKQWIPYILQFHPVEDRWLLEGLSSYIFKRGTTSLEGMKRYLEPLIISQKDNDKGSNDTEEKNLKQFKLFYDIESMLGTDEWIKNLKSYYKQNAFKVSDSQTFIKLLLEDSSQEVNNLFNTYSEQSDREDGTR